MTGISRRNTLVLGLGMAVTACGGSDGMAPVTSVTGSTPTPTPTPTPTATPTPTPTPTATPSASIKAAAESRNMRFGTTFNAGGANSGSYQNPSYAALIEADCDIVVPENELKMPSLRPTEATFNFGPADAMLAYADSKGIAMRGHNLLWYRPDSYILPGWVTSDKVLTGSDAAAARARAQQIVVDHITGVAAHYGDRIKSWDVVNEAVDPGTGAVRDNVLAKAVGGDTSLLDLAFRTARAKFPNAELVYNDYMDGGTPTHRTGVLNLLKGFKDRGVPVDTLGVQSHIGFYGLNGSDPINSAINYNISNMKPFLDAVVAMGYKIKITEMDVNDVNVPGTVADRDAATAAFAKAWLNLVLGYGDSVKDVLFWGMCDKYSWLQDAAFGTRSDGQPKRPDPYDANFQAKPMRQSIIDAFNATTKRA